MGLTVIGVDGGNSKTDLVVVTVEGEPVAYVRGPGSNSHGIGADGVVDVLSALVDRTGVETPAAYGAFFLCGADVPADVAELTAAVRAQDWVRVAIVDNDTFALLRAGTDAPDAVAVVCGSGINCVGRSAAGGVVRYPSLGWETGDWGGADMLGRDLLFFAARAEDGRGEPTVLADIVTSHFGLPTVTAVGEAVHYRRLRPERLGELAPATVAAAEAGDAVARMLVERLADEIVLLAARAIRDLGLDGRTVDVVLGGGMLRGGLLVDEVAARLPAGAHAVVATDPPVLGAALAALDAAGARPFAAERLREGFAAGLSRVDAR